MRVAFASSDGTTVDRHFAQTESYYFWEFSPETAHSIGSVQVEANDGEGEDRILARAQLLEGCTLVVSMQIGGPAAAKLAARHIQPLKTTTEVPIRDLVEKLKAALQGRPAPWLAKAMGLKVQRSLETNEEE
ncbi:MAG TPA: NifB/NifX family molybdenum-iron cluster-binding protein [Polyangiaceae bacterium]|nr:NifB/NifX family molybdenum-iron cluster-binding protein [Polyangiaceae bacterium]